MSRICVKNLAKYVEEDQLRALFSEKGEITDVKLMHTKDGRSRQFAFIGFRTDHEAQEAIRYFNRSYLGTSRIACEVAQKPGDRNLSRPWSRYSKTKDSIMTTLDVTKHTRAKGQGDKSKDTVAIDDPQLQDFLHVMQPRAKLKLWANDTSVAFNFSNNHLISNKDNKVTSEAIHPILVQSGSLISGLPNNLEHNKSCELEHDEVISDMNYFKSRMIKEWSDSDSSDDEDDSLCIDDDDKDNHSPASEHEENCNYNPFKGAPRNGSEDIDPEGKKDAHGKGIANDKAQCNAPEKESQSSDPEYENGVFESCRLFVRNLPYTTTEQELQQHVSSELLPASKFGGGALEVHLVVDKDTKRSKGIAYILFSGSKVAASALEKLDHSTLQGRLLHVMPAIQRPLNNEENNDLKVQKSKTLKQRRVEERKAAEANGDTRAWNSLFIRPDTVAENIARKYCISKSDLFDRDADSLAACIALGEAEVILETKMALTNAGVDVESLEQLANCKVGGLKRSNHVLLVKNLPYGSTENELAKMFGKFGCLDKIILPPTKTLALVVFLEPAEAKAAFRCLAYKRYKDGPLYLEWAPSNILSQSSTSKKNEMNSGIGEHDAKRLVLEQNVERISDVDIDPDRVEARSLYVKNLNFKTTDEGLRKHFREHMKAGVILSVKVNKHLKNRKQVSHGFGFVEFDSTETAINVCRDLQGTVLDGHALILQLGRVKNDGQVQKKVEKDRSSTKLFVRNIPFEATRKTLRNLFSTYGKIKCLRLPKKIAGHRGFVFVEYATQQEAETCLRTLSGTHLLGRRLVIERAKCSESLDELRARTATQFSGLNGFENATKLSKKRKHLSILDEGN